MKFGSKGQSAWFDILIIFLSLMIFTGLMWTYTITAKSPTTNNQMRMQDYTQSMLIRTLYTTYPESSTDARYNGKSISDIMGMYLSNKNVFAMDNSNPPQPKLLKTAIEQVVKSPAFQSRPESSLEWFIFEADSEDFCFHIYNNGQVGQVDQVSVCDKAAVPSNAFTSAIADIPIVKSAGYNTKRVKLTIVWARA